jgi:hypothetical protein
MEIAIHCFSIIFLAESKRSTTFVCKNRKNMCLTQENKDETVDLCVINTKVYTIETI